LPYYGYAALTAAATPLLHMHQWLKLRAALSPARVGERLGKPTQPRPAGKLVWLHAVSLGEFLSILPVVKALRSANPAPQVLVTTTTLSSATIARQRLLAPVVHQFAPLDTPLATGRFLAHWHPDLAVFVESEIWPRQIVRAHRRGIPLALVNARMSARSLRHWGKLPRTAAALLGRFAWVACQVEPTQRGLVALGAPPTRTETIGDLKTCAKGLPCSEPTRGQLARAMRGRLLWVAASTHEGEEAELATAHALVLARHPQALLLLVPRHPHRAASIEALLQAKGLRTARRSTNAPITAQTQVYIADTFGELGLWYALAAIAFVGGSFVRVGGHNPYEPAHAGCAILHGPQVANFHHAYADMHRHGACQEVGDGAQLGARVLALADPETRNRLGSAARAYVAGGERICHRVTTRLLALLRQAERAGDARTL